MQEEEALFIERYFEGKKLLYEGNYKESLNLLKYAHNELIIKRDNLIYYKLYINCAITLALALDYLGLYDEENEIFQELLKFAPNEYFLGKRSNSVLYILRWFERAWWSNYINISVITLFHIHTVLYYYTYR